MPVHATNVEHILQLIDDSHLIRDVDKARFKLRVKNLNPKELNKVQNYLESETDALMSTFNQVVEDNLKSNPESSLAEKINDFLKRKRLGMARAEETDSQSEEKKELKKIEDGLLEEKKRKKSYLGLLVAGALLLVTLGVAYWFFILYLPAHPPVVQADNVVEETNN